MVIFYYYVAGLFIVRLGPSILIVIGIAGTYLIYWGQNLGCWVRNTFFGTSLVSPPLFVTERQDHTPLAMCGYFLGNGVCVLLALIRVMPLIIFWRSSTQDPRFRDSPAFKAYTLIGEIDRFRQWISLLPYSAIFHLLVLGPITIVSYLFIYG